MRLLVLTQSVDLNDPILGFFHGWLEKFAATFERIEVVCLKEGAHRLPANVRVYSLGKEVGTSRLSRIIRFYRLIFSLRNEYDTVFVHMNPEYVLLGGIMWRAWGKRIVLWRNHQIGGTVIWLAARIAHTMLYTSPASYVARFKNAKKMPIGIDTELFRAKSSAPAKDAILFLGRLDAVKKPDVFLEAIALLRKRGNRTPVDVVGGPTHGREAYAEALKRKFSGLKDLSFHADIRNDETPALYASHSIYVNLTPSGSFDKTIGEAAASGCIVVAANDALRDILPRELMVDPDSAESVASSIEKALALGESERIALSRKLSAYVEENHSFAVLMKNLVPLLS